VPTTVATVTVDVIVSTCNNGWLAKHPKVVIDVQVDVRQTASESEAVKERYVLPKLRPLTVTELLPLTALFICPYESTAASKLIALICVPAISPTDTADTSTCVTGKFDKHVSVVDDNQEAVRHTPPESDAVAVRSKGPKFRPEIVNELCALRAAFVCPYESNAASKVYPRVDVPTKEPTVTTD